MRIRIRKHLTSYWPLATSDCALALLLLSSTAFAEGTRIWEQSKFDDLSKGTATGIALRSAGGLELAPAFKTLSTTPSTYIWSIAADQAGNLYAAAGAPARVYRINPAGQATVIFEPQELQVQAVLVDKSGAIYAATNPDGKIYKIENRSKVDTTKNSPERIKSAVDPAWSSTVYFDPATKYIWDLALDNAGSLYAATGDKGQIFRVTPKGEHSVFFKSDEAHIRVLAFDSKGNLIAGSDGSGLVYRISPSGESFVLYSAPKKEITALAIDKAGDIYAAGVGEKRPSQPASGYSVGNPSSAPSAAQAQAQAQAGIVISGTSIPGSAPSTSPAFPFPGTNSGGGSDVYRISSDGAPTRIWTSPNDLVYALAFDQRGHLLAGTGNRGHIYTVDNATGSEDDFTDLVKASATQVTAFVAMPNGGLYVSTSNLGKIFLLGATPESEGSYDSDVFDARNFSRWGIAEFRGAGTVDLFARSGNVDNPDRNWSSWEKVDLQKNGEVSVPPARFIQWRTVLHAGNPAPRVESVRLNYLPKNVAPDFDDVSVQAGVHYVSAPKQSGQDMNSVLGGSNQPQPHFDNPPPITRDTNSIGVKWSTHDDNDDQMVYSLYYRGENETRWLLLKDNITDKFYSFDASLLPDGGYFVKVVASDAPSHSPEQALTAEKESARFEVDTTPPQIQGLTAIVEAGQIHVTFHATDSFSPLKRAEYSVDASDWQFVEPVGQLSDSKTESYDFRVSVPPMSARAAFANKQDSGAMEHVVVIRVYDRYDNMNSAKTVTRGK